MMTTLLWIQCGACGGDSMSLLELDDPTLPELLRDSGIEILWHPSLSPGATNQLKTIVRGILDGVVELDILCVEGSVIRGPGGTGMFDTCGGRPKKEMVSTLAEHAGTVLAVGTCSSYGGLPVRGEVGATGLQFLRMDAGGFLGKDYRSRLGRPVICVPGCPCPPEVLGAVLEVLAAGRDIELDSFQRPVDWYRALVHQGCTRNEYHEFRVEEQEFGHPGCLFFHLGCLGPLTYGPCNTHPRHGHGSGPRVGIPCLGCMRPDFPLDQPFFRTRTLEGVPLDLPLGVDRAHFLAYKIMAHEAAPQRLRDRRNRV